MSNEVLVKQGNKAEWSIDSTPIDPKRLPDGVPYVEREYGIILEETILTDGVAQLSRSIPIIAGEKYTVHLDSGDVDSICKELDMGNGAMFLYLGNSKQMTGIDNGDTFVVATLKTGESMSQCIDESKGTKISVTGPIMANLHNYELWTFTLEDGDTVIKKVAVSE